VGIADSPGTAAADRDCVGWACGADSYERMPPAVWFDDAFQVGQFAVAWATTIPGASRTMAWRACLAVILGSLSREPLLQRIDYSL
jgi:hypothetical protein